MSKTKVSTALRDAKRHAKKMQAKARAEARLRAEGAVEERARIAALLVHEGAQLLVGHTCENDGSCRWCFAVARLADIVTKVERGDGV